MMVIKKIPEYIQKSNVFLYPFLGIKRGRSIVPQKTYLEWEGMYKIEDLKFIAVYHIRDDEEYKEFEENVLFKVPYFENFFDLDDGDGAYVFDFSEMKEDYLHVANGTYSQMSPKSKKTIVNFFRNNKNHQAYMESYLYPSKYFTNYAKLLGVTKELLMEVGELCSKPDDEKEVLKVPAKVSEFQFFN